VLNANSIAGVSYLKITEVERAPRFRSSARWLQLLAGIASENGAIPTLLDILARLEFSVSLNIDNLAVQLNTEHILAHF